MHKSQGFGNTGTRGSQIEYLEFLKGEFPKNKADLFDGINTTWSRLDGGKAIGDILYALENNFNFKDPSANIPSLLEAYTLIQDLPSSHWKTIKIEEIKELILNCTGLYLEAFAGVQSISPNGNLKVTIEAINRSNIDIELGSVNSSIILFPSSLVATPLNENKKYTLESIENSFSATNYSTPYWLKEKGSLGMYQVHNKDLIGFPEIVNQFPVTFNLTINGINFHIDKNIIYKFNDPVKGEVYRPFELLPEVSSSIPEKVIVFPTENAREIPVEIRAGKENISGSVSLEHPAGWIISPKNISFKLDNIGESQTVFFTVQPPVNQSEGMLRPIVQIRGTIYDKELIEINYDHIPFQYVLLPSEAKVVHISLEKKGQHIGYIKGAGDAIPESLKQIGYSVTTINPSEITKEDLEQYDAIVVGIRAYNTVPELTFKQKELNRYIEEGGTLILQYNTNHRLVTKDLAPYPITLSRDRVTDEFSEVQILAPDHKILNSPNKITSADFDGWVQERGLYFPNEWSDEFTPILGMNDSNYPQTKGSLLVAQYGKGYYIYTGLSFFRELPAGVSGAYRLFANLLSIGK